MDIKQARPNRFHNLPRFKIRFNSRKKSCGGARHSCLCRVPTNNFLPNCIEWLRGTKSYENTTLCQIL